MNPKIKLLIELGSSPPDLARAQRAAAQVVHVGGHCAATLSALLQHSGIDVPMTVNAGALADVLEKRGWGRIAVADYQAGDVAVSEDLNGNGMPDHIFLILARETATEARIADNQGLAHLRSLTGKDGRTPAAYLLRAPG